LSRIADEIIQEVRDRVDIVELIGRHLTLKKSGRNHVGLCPFHGEKTPSFNVNSDRQSYYCFGCNEGGNAFTFLMHVENLTFPEAVRTLARECGIEVPESSGGGRSNFETLHRANEVAQARYCKALLVPGNPALAYLEKRGLSADAIEKFQVGYAPDSWDAVASALRDEGISPEIGAQVGLLAERQSGGYYDRLRDRVTFPIRDVRGRVIGFGGRAISPDQEPKYLNTPETPIFHKRAALYGYPDALGPIRSAARVVVVEGYFDRIALDLAGVSNAVATCGTALTPDHIRDLRRRTGEVVLLFDGDEAGQRALEKALQLLLPEGLRVRAAALPTGDDPDSFSAREGTAALSALVDSAAPAIETVIERVVAGGHDTAWKTADAVAEVVPMLALIPGAVERSEYATQLALAVGTQPRHVEAAVTAQRRGEDPRDSVPVRPRKSGPEDRIAAQLVRSLIEYPSLIERIPTDELLSLLPAGPAEEIVRALASGPLAETERLDVEAVCENLGDDTKKLLRELATNNAELDADTATRILDDTIQWLRKRLRKEEGRALTQQLRGEGDDWRTVLEKKQRLREQSVRQEPRRTSIYDVKTNVKH
jgi:DNA primase